MSQSPLNADTRRARLMCYLAAAVFAGSGLLLLLLPFEIAPAIRWVGAGFHAILAVAVLLYGRQLNVES